VAWSNWLPDTADPSAESSLGRPVSENARDTARDRCSAIRSFLVSSSTCLSSSRIRLRKPFYQQLQVTPPSARWRAHTSWGPSSCPRGLARRTRSPASQPGMMNTVHHRARRTDDKTLPGCSCLISPAKAGRTFVFLILQLSHDRSFRRAWNGRRFFAWAVNCASTGLWRWVVLASG
jgi:hypothetical protein